MARKPCMPPLCQAPVQADLPRSTDVVRSASRRVGCGRGPGRSQRDRSCSRCRRRAKTSPQAHELMRFLLGGPWEETVDGAKSILHHFETMGNHCLLVFAGESSFPKFGGARFRPSTVWVSQKKTGPTRVNSCWFLQKGESVP